MQSDTTPVPEPEAQAAGHNTQGTSRGKALVQHEIPVAMQDGDTQASRRAAPEDLGDFFADFRADLTWPNPELEQISQNEHSRLERSRHGVIENPRELGEDRGLCIREVQV